LSSKRHKQARKRLRQSEKRRELNRFYKSTARTYLKRAHEAVEEKDLSRAEELFRLAQAKMGKAARKRVFHPNHASRKISRLSRRINQLKAAL